VVGLRVEWWCCVLQHLLAQACASLRKHSSRCAASHALLFSFSVLLLLFGSLLLA
jgi:hypothetical protein